MIEPQKKNLHAALLNWFLDKKFKKRFSSINFLPLNLVEQNKSLLVIGNHSTWWDGFLVWELNRRVLNRNFYAMMLEEQLKRFWFFQKVGCFSIDPGSRSVVKSLAFGAKLLENPKNMLLFYPQGKFSSLYNENFEFNKGVDFILKRCSESSILLFYALFIDFSANELPYADIYFKSIEINKDDTFTTIETKYKEFYTEAKQKHISDFKI